LLGLVISAGVNGIGSQPPFEFDPMRIARIRVQQSNEPTFGLGVHTGVDATIDCAYRHNHLNEPAVESPTFRRNAASPFVRCFSTVLIDIPQHLAICALVMPSENLSRHIRRRLGGNCKIASRNHANFCRYAANSSGRRSGGMDSPPSSATACA